MNIECTCLDEIKEFIRERYEYSKNEYKVKFGTSPRYAWEYWRGETEAFRSILEFLDILPSRKIFVE